MIALLVGEQRPPKRRDDERKEWTGYGKEWAPLTVGIARNAQSGRQECG